MKKRLVYPGTEEAEREKEQSSRRALVNLRLEKAPDIVETAKGFSPNYDKFDKLGMSPEEALIWCNMD